MNKSKLTLDRIRKAVTSKGNTWFGSGNYNLNIVLIRNCETGTKITNKFDDYLTVSYNVGKTEHFHIWRVTTDPGLTPALRPKNPKGVAILAPGQYRGAYTLRLHKGRYEALCQAKPVNVYRDFNRDGKYDFSAAHIESGIFGINIHKAGQESIIVNNWSEGCTVFAKEKEFDEFMKICNVAKNHWGNRFTVTLINKSDIK